MDKNTFFEITIKILAGEASDNEQREFNNYLLDEDYLKLYEWLRQEWQKERKYQSGEFDYERGLKKLRSKIERATEANPAREVRILPMRRTIQIAACLLIFISVAIIGYRLNESRITRQQVSMVTVSVPRGERKTIGLSDGSTVFLNSGATVRYPSVFSERRREVELSGEAFFEVSKDRKKPFIVHSGGFETTVLGTSFDVNYSGENILVTVETGKVQVAKTGHDAGIILEKGQQATFNSLQDSFERTAVVTAKYTEWRDNILRFDEIAVKEAFGKMEVWYDITIKCDSTALLNRTIRGTYRNEPLQKVLDDLAFMLDFTYTYENDSIIIIH